MKMHDLSLQWAIPQSTVHSIRKVTTPKRNSRSGYQRHSGIYVCTLSNQHRATELPSLSTVTQLCVAHLQHVKPAHYLDISTLFCYTILSVVGKEIPRTAWHHLYPKPGEGGNYAKETTSGIQFSTGPSTLQIDCLDPIIGEAILTQLVEKARDARSALIVEVETGKFLSQFVREPITSI